MYIVWLIDEVDGSNYWRFQSASRFDCEVWVINHQYDCPKKCHYEIDMAK